MGAVMRWRLRIEEAYLGAFSEYGISLTPGLYVFEDMGNPLCLVGQYPNGDGIFFTFPLRHSPAWASQQVPDASNATHSLTPCYLPLTISCPPHVGGFLHPHCYGGVPVHIDKCKRSHKAHYIVLHTFKGDGVMVCQLYAAALYRGQAASHFSRVGQIMMKGFSTKQAALQSVRLTTPSVVKTPSLVSYIQSQLEHLEMLEENDLHGIIHDPVTINGRSTGRTTPLLYTYNLESHDETLWEEPSDDDEVSISPGHIIRVELSGRPPDSPHSSAVNGPDPHERVPEVIPSTGNSISSHSTCSSEEERERSEEHERSKDRLRSLTIPPLPLATKELHQWVQNLPWQLSGQHWCHA
jgi:hypothetical protein